MTAQMFVYEKNTGIQIDYDYTYTTGSYGATATANNPTGHSSLNVYKWGGSIYNGGHSSSGTAYTFLKP